MIRFLGIFLEIFLFIWTPAMKTTHKPLRLIWSYIKEFCSGSDVLWPVTPSMFSLIGWKEQFILLFWCFMLLPGGRSCLVITLICHIHFFYVSIILCYICDNNCVWTHWQCHTNSYLAILQYNRIQIDLALAKHFMVQFSMMPNKIPRSWQHSACSIFRTSLINAQCQSKFWD